MLFRSVRGRKGVSKIEESRTVVTIGTETEDTIVVVVVGVVDGHDNFPLYEVLQFLHSLFAIPRASSRNITGSGLYTGHVLS